MFDVGEHGEGETSGEVTGHALFFGGRRAQSEVQDTLFVRSILPTLENDSKETGDGIARGRSTKWRNPVQRND